MPTYTYRCTECDAQFEELRPMAERDTPIECPNCGGKSMPVIAGVQDTPSKWGDTPKEPHKKTGLGRYAS